MKVEPAMDVTGVTLPLPSINVQRFRAIRHLSLPELARVTLFVGQNNAGKTSLLEAVRLFSAANPLSVLATVLRERSGIRFSPARRLSATLDVAVEDLEAAVAAARSIFHGTYSGAEDTVQIDGPRERLVLSLPWSSRISKDDRGRLVELELFLGPSSPLIQIDRGARKWELTYDLLMRRRSVVVRRGAMPAVFIPAQGMSGAAIASFWDRVADDGYAADVEEVLRTMVPGLERVYLVGAGGSQLRTVALQIRGLRRLVPIANMGDGTNRVFAVALALVSAREGLVLIDEVENGLHHSVQDQVWTAIFSLAAQMGTQVLATTHSWDTVVGFQSAANRYAAAGLLYRLEQETDGSIYVERYTQHEVGIAAEQQIEVR